MKIRPLILLLLLLTSYLSLYAQTTQTISADSLDYRKDSNSYLLVLKAGQPVIASLNAFMAKEKLPGAYFTGIGAVKNTEVAYYNIDQRKYVYKKFPGSMEVLAFNGNLGYFDNQPIVHPHITLGAPDYTVHGGHLKEAEVSLVLEIFITPVSKKIEREWNDHFPELRTMKPVKDSTQVPGR